MTRTIGIVAAIAACCLHLGAPTAAGTKTRGNGGSDPDIGHTHGSSSGMVPARTSRRRCLRMKTWFSIVAITVALSLGTATVTRAGGPPSAPLTRCPRDSVVSGSGCMDKYEASVWRVPNPTTQNRTLVLKIQRGAATLGELLASGATPLGRATDDYAPCADSGQNCANDIYAVSVLGVTPSAWITWFQAQQACTNSGKRLPSSAEWQAAVVGTPDPGPDNGMTDCNTTAVLVVGTGLRSSCVSAIGAFDMVGNLAEWVADWVPRSLPECVNFWNGDASPSGDFQCLVGASDAGEPGALVRGGEFGSMTFAGPLTLYGNVPPSGSFNVVGFRCAR